VNHFVDLLLTLRHDHSEIIAGTIQPRDWHRSLLSRNCFRKTALKNNVR
jgi:hypothetical protein